MPPKKGKTTKKKIVEESDDVTNIDVQYNPDIVASLLQTLYLQTEAKCTQIQKEADFMATSIRQAYHLELIKIPKNVKEMPLSKFREEFGESLDTVTKLAIAGSSAQGKFQTNPEVARSSRSSMRVFQTPSHSRNAVAMRNPKEGEKILSENGSPLGEFTTVVKAPRNNNNIVPATPGVFVPLKDGEILDIDSANIDNLSDDLKEDALAKMEAMMNNMQSLMSKLGGGKQLNSTKC